MILNLRRFYNQLNIMYKKIFSSLIVASILPAMLIAETTASVPENPTPGSQKPQSPTTLPVIVVDDRPTAPGKAKPGKRYEVMTSLSGEFISFVIPFESYPVVCELVQETYPYGYWTATFTDASSCEMPFDGTVGDYRLTLTTASNSTYAGYFTLE